MKEVNVKWSKSVVYKKPKTKKIYDYIVFFDTETYTDENDEVHISYMAYYIYDVNYDTIIDKRILSIRDFIKMDKIPHIVIVFDSEDELKNFFTSLIIKITQCKNQTTHTIVTSHNLHFDKIAIDFEHLILNNYELKSFDLSKNFIMSYVKKTNNARYYIHFIDNTNFFKSSLKKLGKSFGIKKEEVEGEYQFLTEKNIDYVFRDVEILYRAFIFIFKMFNKYTNNNFKFTLASNSFTIVKNYIAKYGVEAHNFKPTVELEKLSYRGGRTETHIIGYIEEKIYKLDVNSLYPYVMKNFEYPIKLEFFIDYDNWEAYIRKETKKGVKYIKTHPFKITVKDLEKSEYLWIAEVDVEPTHNVLGIRVYLQKHKNYKDLYFKQKVLKSKFHFKKEKLEKVSDYDLTLTFSIKNIKVRAFITSGEYEMLKDYIKIHKIHKIALYSKAKIFQDFVDEFYSKRLNAKKEGKDALQLFYKIVLNSSYGKFGQVNSEFIEIKDENIVEEVMKSAKSIIYDEVRIDDNTYIVFNSKVYQRSEYNYKSVQSFIAIASFVTSYARAYITQLMLLALQSGKVYYMDTDSLFVDESAYKVLVEKGFVDNSELGKLKLEGVYDGLLVVSEKQYVLWKDKGDKLLLELKFKGVRIVALLDYLKALNLVEFSKEVDSVQDYYYVHRSIDFDIFTTKDRLFDLFWALLEFEVEDWKFSKTLETLRRFKDMKVIFVRQDKKRRAVKFKNVFVLVDEHLYVSSLLFS